MALKDAGAIDNTDDIVVRNGLPDKEFSANRPFDLEKAFIDAYALLEKANAEQNPDAYAKGICELSSNMKAEITQKFMTSSGDLGHTMQEWINRSPYPDNAMLELLKRGQNIVKRTNTLNNSQTPHGTGIYRGDATDRINSQLFGNNVVEYVNTRGRDYITAQIVPGKPVQMEPVSVFQVETTLNGFHPRIQVK